MAATDYIFFPTRLAANSIRSLARYVRLSRQLRVGRDEVVLEVGAGHRPMIRSDVLVDKFAADSFERDGQGVYTGRPLVIGDAERLPFKDRSFDFVVSYALLEHLADPAAFLEEMMRVAGRGVIICPGRLHEIFTAFPYHRWFVDVESGQLILTRKEKPYVDKVVRRFLDKHRANFVAFQNLWHFWHWTWPDFYHVYRWDKTIDYRIDDKPGVDESAFAFASLEPEDQKARRPAWYIRLMYWTAVTACRRLMGGAKVDPTGRLACPECKGELARRERAYHCPACRVGYPILGRGRREMPVLLTEEAFDLKGSDQ